MVCIQKTSKKHIASSWTWSASGTHLLLIGKGSLLVGVVFKLVLQYPDEDMTWYQAFTLGSVISATDPVAVVALLKELGATLRFNVLIEGYIIPL